MTKEEISLEEEVLGVVRKDREHFLHAANVLSHYARGKVLQMVWKLINLGVIKIDNNKKLYLSTERETKMANTNRSEAARKAHETRRRNAQKRSDAARKAWATRRAQAEFERRSQAAKRAWATRRGE